MTQAFKEWTHFEDFPRFMAGINEVKRIDDRHLHWCAQVGGKVEEWDAEITELIPDRVIGWRSTSGAENSGLVHFEPSGRGGTRLDVRINYEPRNWLEKIGAALGVVRRRVEGDLNRFKQVIERHRMPHVMERGF